ncbi:MAG: hypothetical protein WCP97_08925 [bacterium]
MKSGNRILEVGVGALGLGIGFLLTAEKKSKKIESPNRKLLSSALLALNVSGLVYKCLGKNSWNNSLDNANLKTQDGLIVTSVKDDCLSPHYDQTR